MTTSTLAPAQAQRVPPVLSAQDLPNVLHSRPVLPFLAQPYNPLNPVFLLENPLFFPNVLLLFS